MTASTAPGSIIAERLPAAAPAPDGWLDSTVAAAYLSLGRDALHKLFGVTATGVRTMQMRRHSVTRGRTRGTTARWKKAVVTLKDGDSIAVFEG